MVWPAILLAMFVRIAHAEFMPAQTSTTFAFPFESVRSPNIPCAWKLHARRKYVDIVLRGLRSRTRTPYPALCYFACRRRRDVYGHRYTQIIQFPQGATQECPNGAGCCCVLSLAYICVALAHQHIPRAGIPVFDAAAPFAQRAYKSVCGITSSRRNVRMRVYRVALFQIYVLLSQLTGQTRI